MGERPQKVSSWATVDATLNIPETRIVRANSEPEKNLSPLSGLLDPGLGFERPDHS
jgi:hypothetical protein